jgi:putative PIN family toxin of toxin-antitoxin system
VSVQPIPRVVFDTNVALSALLFTQGRLSWLVGHWQSGNCIPLVSPVAAHELAKVLAYAKFQLSAGEQLDVLANYIPFCEAIEIVKPSPLVCRDPKDQPYLDLAYSGKASLLVTDDADLLALAGQTQFVIETPEAYRLRISIAFSELL